VLSIFRRHRHGESVVHLSLNVGSYGPEMSFSLLVAIAGRLSSVFRESIRPLTRCVVGGAASVCLLPASANAESFRVVVLPDTQFYSAAQGDILTFQNPFLFQTEWIAQNREARDIQYVVHVGDLVDDSAVEGQWVLADSAMATLDEALQPLDEAGIPYGVVRGNHDGPIRGDSSFLTWFGPTRFEGKPFYRGSDPSGFNSFHIFEVSGQPFLVLLTDWTMDANELAWARDVLETHPKIPTILVSHVIIGASNNSVQPDTADNAVDTTNGNLLWEQLIRDNDQIFMTLNGHLATAAWRLKANDAGNDVLQVLADYQQQTPSGGGFLVELTFDLSAGTIRAETFSPWLEFVLASNPPASIRNFLENFAPPPRLTGPSNEFEINLDFSTSRFCNTAETCGLNGPVRASVPLLPMLGMIGAIGIFGFIATRRLAR